MQAMNIFLPAPGSASLRRGRTHDAGRPYLITTSTADRAPIFARSTHARTAAALLNDARTCPNARILLWVLMPDHLHLLLELGVDEALGRSVGRIRAAISRCLPGPGESLWQGSFHDHGLREAESIDSVGRYLLLNPVRAGLVLSVKDWPWRGGVLNEAMEAGVELAGAEV